MRETTFHRDFFECQAPVIKNAKAFGLKRLDVLIETLRRFFISPSPNKYPLFPFKTFVVSVFIGEFLNKRTKKAFTSFTDA
ncbi:MAG: hypothetical protein IKW32_02365 [Bacteroidaceae bacterium]|nr:hypothetical protein [Bacteroidaceae bacterium]